MRELKRFYGDATVRADGDRFLVTLDGKPVLTPAKQRLSLPIRALAEAIAGEWAAQGERVDPATMPLLRLATTALDRVVPAREAVIDQIAAYGASDLLCYRAEAPPRLVDLQVRAWQPHLDRAAALWGVVLRTTRGVAPVRQDEGALARLRARVADHDDLTLAALHAAVPVTGSLVLGLLLAEGEIDAATAWQAAQLEADFQAETWGRDAEAEAATEAKHRELLAARAFLDLLRS